MSAFFHTFLAVRLDPEVGSRIPGELRPRLACITPRTDPFLPHSKHQRLVLHA